MIPSGNLSFMKRTLFKWMSGSWTQKDWDRFGWWPLCVGGIILAEGLHDLGRQDMLLLNYTVAFVLQLRKITENLRDCSRVVRQHSLCWLDCLFRGSPDWPAKHQSSWVTRGRLLSALGPNKWLQSCRTKGLSVWGRRITPPYPCMS
jgi:hypothetical protein